LFVICFAAGGAAQTSVQTPVSSQGVMSLTLEDAVARGLRENVAARLGEADVTSARGERWTALQDLLPTAFARVGITREVINLAAFGFSVPGFPSIVGPFNVHDARLSVSQPTSICTHCTSRSLAAADLRAAEFDLRDTRALVSRRCAICICWRSPMRAG
jgi:outer membrane protein TolC